MKGYYFAIYLAAASCFPNQFGVLVLNLDCPAVAANGVSEGTRIPNAPWQIRALGNQATPPQGLAQDQQSEWLASPAFILVPGWGA